MKDKDFPSLNKMIEKDQRAKARWIKVDKALNKVPVIIGAIVLIVLINYFWGVFGRTLNLLQYILR